MRLSAALPLLAAVMYGTPCSHASSSLSLEELNSIIRSAATAPESIEYASVPDGPATTTDSFEAEIQQQWDTNYQHGNDVSAPYLVCDYTTPGNGYSRAQNINSSCGLSVGDNVVQNLDDRTCFDAQLLPGDALSCAAVSDDILVLPRTPWSKMNYEVLTGSINYGENFNSTISGKTSVGKARYSADLCGSGQENENLITAKNRLTKVYTDTPKCEGVQLRGDFTFSLIGSKLKLYQKADASIEYECVIALVNSLAGNPFVCDVEFDPEVTTSNQDGRWIIQGSMFDDNNQMVLPLHDAGIRGEGMVAQMSDTGLSVNSCYFYDSSGEVPRDKSKTVDTSLRKVIQYYAGQDDRDDDGHGTHCAGTILGKLCIGSGCSPDNDNDRQGTAPEAKIAVYDIGEAKDGGGLYPDDADPMFTTGVLAGAYAHSASWGNGVNSYQSRDRDFDSFQYENPEFLVVFAAGNSGGNLNTYSSSAVAKNNLNVCAARNKGQGLGELYMASFSSMGPSQDGRIKPDICAPGQVIDSADNGGSRQCGSVGLSGTSMACPGVAGAALLIRQYFMDGFYPSGTKVPSDGFTPSGALVKAVILNSGRTMLGREGSSSFQSEPYDNSQGFGLISLVDGVYIEGKSKGKVLVYDEVELTNGQEWEETFNLHNCPAEHTSVTLNYFDKENSSTSCNPCIVNRLDLTMEKGPETFYPNGKTSADTKNNAQRIRIPTDQDSITVKVRAANLATATQKFSLVVSGCVDTGTNMPTKTPPPTPTPTAMPVQSSAPTCFEDPEFAVYRGLKNQNIARTCAYIGDEARPWRRKKWCNKLHRGQPIGEICCNTCALTCTEQDIHMPEDYYSPGQSRTFTLPEVVDNVWQIQGRLRCNYITAYYTSGDFILLDSDDNELAKLNIICGGPTNGKDVTKKSGVFEEAVMGVAKVKMQSFWNPGYHSELVSLCDDKNGGMISIM